MCGIRLLAEGGLQGGHALCIRLCLGLDGLGFLCHLGHGFLRLGLLRGLLGFIFGLAEVGGDLFHHLTDLGS